MIAHLLREGITRLQSAGIEEARLDAELLLASACELPRANLLAHGSDPASPALARRFRQLLERRASHEPVAYILGHKEFYGLDLMVDGRVLIPRPETELLVERALGWVRDRSPSPHPASSSDTRRLRVLDVGTGSGAVALALAANLPLEVSIVALDISAAALDVAQANAARHHLEGRVRFVQSDLLAQADGPADLMVANLPYVAHHEWPALAPDIASYEPRLALDGGPDGLECIHRFFVQSPAFLAPGGAIVLEIGWRQAEAVRQMAQAAFPASSLDVHQDGAGLDRVVVVSPSAKAPITAVG